MEFNFDDIINSIEGNPDFEEIPVDIDTFMSSDLFLGSLGMSLSPLQTKMVEASTEIYKKETLVALYGEEEGLARHRRTYNELCFELGKGCQAYEDEVYNPMDGTWTPIGELTDTPINSVASINKLGECVYEDATESWVEGVGQLFKVRTDLGYEVTINENHKLLDSRGYLIPLSDLSVGDGVCVAINLPVKNEWSATSEEILELANCIADEYISDYWTSKLPKKIFSLTKESLLELLDIAMDLDITSGPKSRVSDWQRLFSRVGILSRVVENKEGDYLLEPVYARQQMSGSTYEDKIVSITPEKEREFYTLTAMENHNYVSNGLIHANSGKNETTSVIVCYVVYKLLCLKDPAKYYGKPSGNAIDIINVAINADQAKRNFFDAVVGKIKRAPWFAGKFDDVARHIKFDKNINVYSGNSKAESFEGYNLIMAILDEIAGFGVDADAGNVQGEEIYNMFVDSVVSRYPEEGKVLMLSFPRFKGDFIDKYYNGAIKEKETEIKKHVFKVDPELQDGIVDNEFAIEWEEDHIISYTRPKTYCLRRPSWVINPTRVVEYYKLRFLQDPNVAYGKFACMPPDAIDSYFGSKDKVEKAFRLNRLNVDENGVFAKSFKPESGVKYYMHVDLAQVQDRAAVAMSHIAGWQQTTIFGDQQLVRPKIVVDFVRYWTPTRERMIDISEVKRFIFDIVERGFDVGLVTFDQWHSVDIIQELNGMGVKAEKLSLKKEHYDDFKLAVYEERIVGPHIDILIDELIKLRVTKAGKVDHPLGGHNDMAEAITGSIYNTVAYTDRYLDGDIEIVTYDDLRRQLRDEQLERFDNMKKANNTIVAPPTKIPSDIEEYLKNMKVL